jgi:PAS domain S-box-containing protein
MDLGVAPNKKCYQTFNSSETACPDCGAKKVFEQNASLDAHEYKTVNLNCETVWIELRVTPLKDKDGNVTAALELAVPITERKKAEEKIAWLASFPMLNPSPVLEVSFEGNISYLNSAAESIFPDLKKGGLSHPILSGWNDVLATFRNKKNRTFGRNIKINDAWFYMQFNLLQETQQVRICITNVTEIKQAEEALQESETKFRMYVENSPVAVFVTDPEGKYEYVNEAASKLLGYSIKELTDMDVSQIAFNDNKSAPLNSFASLQENGKILVEKWLKKKDGQAVNVSLNAVKLPSGKLIAFCENITDQKKAEQTLKESEEKYRKLFEESMDAILVADIETGIIVDCNLAASKLVGRQKSELVGQHQSIIHPQEQMDGEFARGFKQHLKDQTKTLETQIMRKTGEIRDVAVKGTIFELKGKKLMQGTFRDITERKQQTHKIESIAKFPSENPNPVFRIDRNGTILYGNAAGASFLNVWNSKVSELAPKHISQVVVDALSSNKRIELKETCGTKNFSLLFAPVTLEGYVNIYANDITERKLMQYALHESEEKFRTITNSVKDAIILINDEAKVVHWNPAAEKTFGYSNVEAIGKEVHELIVPKTMSLEGNEYIRIGVKQFAKTGSGAFTNGNVELLGQRKDGTEFPAKLSLTPIKLQGKWNAVGVVKDVTERKQAEQKLIEAEKRYHTLFNQAPLGVLVIDPQTEKPIEFNDVTYTQLGYSREEFSKLCISDFEAKEKANEVNAHLAKMVREGGDEFETKHRTKNGEIRNVLVNTRAVELAGKPFLSCVFHDITEIRKVQEALMESETQYRQIVNVAQEGIWALDNNHRTVFVNPQMAKMLGYAQSEMVGKNLSQFLNKKCIKQAKQFLGRFKQGVKGRFDCEFGRKDGSHMYVSITVSLISDDEGKPSGTLMMVSDITDRKILEAKVNNYSKHLKSMVELRTVQLKDANERLVKSERLAAIGELAGMVGHDLRNPLAGIKNAAYYLKKKGTAISEAQAKEMLETIDKAIDHSDKICQRPARLLKRDASGTHKIRSTHPCGRGYANDSGSRSNTNCKPRS